MERAEWLNLTGARMRRYPTLHSLYGREFKRFAGRGGKNMHKGSEMSESPERGRGSVVGQEQWREVLLPKENRASNLE